MRTQKELRPIFYFATAIILSQLCGDKIFFIHGTNRLPEKGAMESQLFLSQRWFLIVAIGHEGEHENHLRSIYLPEISENKAKSFHYVLSLDIVEFPGPSYSKYWN